ncbi:MAG: hypothetical protein C0467_06250 [Planctomycetaceae bacterium]|nr:hypothetical protein [Planctomycetaceae bacterium]
MRVFLCASVVALVVAFAVAQDRPDDTVKAAIAAGGGAALTKYPAGRVVGKGVMIVAGNETAFAFEQAYHVPGRFRTHIACEVRGQKWELLQVVDGATARQKINDRLVPVTEAGIRELQLAVLLNEIAQLTPLALDKRFVLKPDKQLKGPDAVGLVAQVRGYPDIRLAFDRTSGHLVRISHRSTDPETGKESDLDSTFTDYKEFAGVVKPTRSVVTRDGRKVVELVVEKLTPLEKIDPAAFVLKE